MSYCFLSADPARPVRGKPGELQGLEADGRQRHHPRPLHLRRGQEGLQGGAEAVRWGIDF